MEDYTQKEIQNLQSNLELIRKAGGWSAEELGQKIGVTKQTIRNLEIHSDQYTMSKTQYIALRSVLDYEVSHNPNNEVLREIVKLILYTDDLNPEEKEKAKAAAIYLVSQKDEKVDMGLVMTTVGFILGTALFSVVKKIVLPSDANSWLEDTDKWIGDTGKYLKVGNTKKG